MERQYGLMHDIEAAFDEVVARIQALLGVYRESSNPAWALHSPTPNADWLARALLDMWYEDGQDGRHTRTYVGLIAATPELMEAVEDVNHAKARFSQVMKHIQEKDAGLVAELKGALPLRHPGLQAHLAGKGLGRLHLKQCWRHLPVAEAPLERIHLSWYSSGRSIKRITASEAADKLAEFNTESPHIQVQLRQLAGLPSSEPLAIIQRQAPVMRANLFYQEPLADGRARRAMNVALPLFIPSPDGRLPTHNEPLPTPPPARTRKERCDQKIESDPFLPSLRAYRYREA